MEEHVKTHHPLEEKDLSKPATKSRPGKVRVRNMEEMLSPRAARKMDVVNSENNDSVYVNYVDNSASHSLVYNLHLNPSV